MELNSWEECIAAYLQILSNLFGPWAKVVFMIFQSSEQSVITFDMDLQYCC